MTEHGPTSANGAEAFPPDNRYRAGEASSRPKYFRVCSNSAARCLAAARLGGNIARPVVGEKIRNASHHLTEGRRAAGDDAERSDEKERRT
jgi:hypothetical protein